MQTLNNRARQRGHFNVPDIWVPLFISIAIILLVVCAVCFGIYEALK